jgi:hypothetical protein
MKKAFERVTLSIMASNLSGVQERLVIMSRAKFGYVSISVGGFTVSTRQFVRVTIFAHIAYSDGKCRRMDGKVSEVAQSCFGNDGCLVPIIINEFVNDHLEDGKLPKIHASMIDTVLERGSAEANHIRRPSE